MRLGSLTWPQAKRRFADVDIALLPVGAIEQHGPHLPLDTDAFDADYLARRVAKACLSPRPLVLPLLPYGVSYHHNDFKGTLSISNTTLSQMVFEIGMSAAANGIRKLVIINGHGGNSATLHYAAQMINRDARIFTCVDSGETSDQDIYALAETKNDVNAGEIETSTTLAIRPELVQMDKSPRMVPRFSSRYLDFTSKRSVGWYAYTQRISRNGVMGDATRATAAKGERIWELMVRRLVELVEDLKGMKIRLPGGPGDGDAAAFQRLPQYFQHLAVELRQLVQADGACLLDDQAGIDQPLQGHLRVVVGHALRDSDAGGHRLEPHEPLSVRVGRDERPLVGPRAPRPLVARARLEREESLDHLAPRHAGQPRGGVRREHGRGLVAHVGDADPQALALDQDRRDVAPA